MKPCLHIVRNFALSLLFLVLPFPVVSSLCLSVSQGGPEHCFRSPPPSPPLHICSSTNLIKPHFNRSRGKWEGDRERQTKRRERETERDGKIKSEKMIETGRLWVLEDRTNIDARTVEMSTTKI